nr:integrase [Nocardia terpenica]
MSGTAVGLVDVTGGESWVERSVLFALPGFVVVGAGRAPLPALERLDGFAPGVVEQARWWEDHVVEVLSGLPPHAGPGVTPRPEYDTAAHTLRQREIAKVAELEAAGNAVSLRRFQRMRRGYEAAGLVGLIDGRTTRQQAATAVDERVAEATRVAVAGETDRSTGTVGRLRRRVEKILAAEHGLAPAQVAEVMPSRAGFYRLVERISAGKHTFGSARTRRSAAKSPAGPFGARTALRPGEWMLIDSSPLNVAVALDNGLTDRVELTWIIDQATRTVPAAVLRPSTKAVDAALLLARCLTPEPMRPGWADAVRMSRSVLPHRRLTDIDERLEHAAARPVIVPETIVTDHGKVFVSQNFRNACRAMGVNFQPTHQGSPWEKGTVESSFSSVDTLFAQYVAGYTGNSVENRGRDPQAEAVWSMLELQELLDEWLVAAWQTREHDGLRDPLMPGKALSPNEKYAALVESAGYVPVPLSEDDYIELLPGCWRAINTYGVKIRHRKYDCKALNPYRRQHSSVHAKRGLWQVHLDPYDVSRIWIRNHHDGGWIMAPWTHLKSAPVPFGEQAWEHGRQILAQRGRDKVTETEIAATVTALLDKAEQGPEGPRRTKATTKDRKVAARTRATSAATSKRPGAPEPPPEPTTPPPEESRKARRAKVIPLPIFNAHEEALKRW